MPFFFDRGHYASIAAILAAAEVQSRVLGNGESSSVEVRLEDGSIVLWGNGMEGTTNKVWRATVVNPEGESRIIITDLPYDALPEVVAARIGDQDYAAELVREG